MRSSLGSKAVQENCCMHMKADTDCKRDRQAILPVCGAGARLLGNDCVLCPRKSVPGCAKGSPVKLKGSQRWLNKGASLIVWVADCVGDSEQVEAAEGGDSVRRSEDTVRLVERGQPGWVGIWTFCPCSAVSQSRWSGVVKTAWQTSLWRGRKHL